MTRKICLSLMLAILLGMAAAGQSKDSNLQTIINSIVDPLEADISTILESTGSDILDTLQANALSGDVFGEATFGSKTFSITLPGIGIMTTSGIGSALSSDTWNSDILPLGPLVGSALSSTLDPILGAGSFDFVTSQLMVWPSVNLGLGLNLGSGFELFANGMYIPFSLISDIAGSSGSMAILNGLEGNILQLQVKLRKVLVQDTPDTIAFSVGLAYALNAFNLDLTVDNASLESIIGGPLDIQGMGSLTVDQMALGAHTLSQNFGLEFNFSKRLIFFVPFLKIAPYVQFSSEDLSMALNTTLTENTTSTQYALEINPGTKNFAVSDLSVLINTGFELDLFIFTLHTGLILDLENIALNLGNLTPEEIVMNGIGVNIGLRLAY